MDCLAIDKTSKTQAHDHTLTAACHCPRFMLWKSHMRP